MFNIICVFAMLRRRRSKRVWDTGARACKHRQTTLLSALGPRGLKMSAGVSTAAATTGLEHYALERTVPDTGTILD